MKRLIFFLFLSLCCVTLSAQSRGGQVRRPSSTVKKNSSAGVTKKKTTVTTTKKSKARNTNKQRRRQTYTYSNQYNDYQDWDTTAVADEAEVDTAEYDYIDEIIQCMVEVEGGSFKMGAVGKYEKDAEEDEYPSHQVTLDAFFISAFPVTQAQWKAVMGNNPSSFIGDERPVTNVSWDDCQEFIERLQQLTGIEFRLPTEAEWEYAACGGQNSEGNLYAGTSDNLDDYAWYGDHSDDNTHNVGLKKANELGLYDMSGNVLEWCYDYYGAYTSDEVDNPQGPSSGKFRVVRGGSSWSPAENCRVTYRCNYEPTNTYSRLGFRLAASANESR